MLYRIAESTKYQARPWSPLVIRLFGLLALLMTLSGCEINEEPVNASQTPSGGSPTSPPPRRHHRHRRRGRHRRHHRRRRRWTR